MIDRSYQQASVCGAAVSVLGLPQIKVQVFPTEELAILPFLHFEIIVPWNHLDGYIKHLFSRPLSIRKP